MYLAQDYLVQGFSEIQRNWARVVYLKVERWQRFDWCRTRIRIVITVLVPAFIDHVLCDITCNGLVCWTFELYPVPFVWLREMFSSVYVSICNGLQRLLLGYWSSRSSI